MRFAYADPPYLGLAAKFYGHLHPRAADYDRVETHAALIDRLCSDYPDGWALSLHAPSLRDLLPLCPPDVRICAWVKPWCSFKPGVGLAHAWEPVILRGGRRRERLIGTVRDWCAVNAVSGTGLRGAKPEGLVWWMLDAWNVLPGDEVDDLFPGSGVVGRVVDRWRASWSGQVQTPLFAEDAPC